MKEIELWICNAHKILEETKEVLKSKKCNIDLTSKVLLKNECKEIVKLLKCIEKDKSKEKNKQQLQTICIRLQTTLEGITNFYS